MQLKTIVILLLLLPVLATANVYQIVDEEGNITFTDKKPEPNAQPVELDKPQTFSAPPSRRFFSQPAPVTQETVKVDYQLKLLSPTPNESFRQNSGNVTITVGVSPALKPGHLLEVFDNGKSLGKPGMSTSFALTGADRGEHKIRMIVTDKTGQVIKENTDVFYLQRRSKILNP